MKIDHLISPKKIKYSLLFLCFAALLLAASVTVSEGALLVQQDNALIYNAETDSSATDIAAQVKCEPTFEVAQSDRQTKNSNLAKTVRSEVSTQVSWKVKAQCGYAWSD